MVILDGCRADIIKEVVHEYDFLSDDCARSIGGGSDIWMERTFDSEHSSCMSETLYITSNPFSNEKIDSKEFAGVEEVWRNGWDDELGTVPPRNVTDTAIKMSRHKDHRRTIVHYMQPHHPFIPNPIDEGINKKDPSNPHQSIWPMLREGDIEKNDAWEAYRDNLLYVLDDVKLLLNNIEKENILITADHGNAFGEWGVWGHGQYPISSVRSVPWVRTSAKDKKSYDTDVSSKGEDIDTTVSERLQSLGYKQ